MKKKWFCLYYALKTNKLLMKMKITVFLILITVLTGLAAESYSQATRLSLSIDNSTVKQVLNQIEDQSEFRFFYRGSIDVERNVSISVKNTKISDILDELFEYTDIKYEVRGRQIGSDPVTGWPKGRSWPVSGCDRSTVEPGLRPRGECRGS